MLAALMAISLGTLGSQRLLAQTCAPFPSGVVPFGMIYYLSFPNAQGDRLVVGEMAGRQVILEQIPLPALQTKNSVVRLRLLQAFSSRLMSRHRRSVTAISTLLVPAFSIPLPEGLILVAGSSTQTHSPPI